MEEMPYLADSYLAAFQSWLYDDTNDAKRNLMLRARDAMFEEAGVAFVDFTQRTRLPYGR